MTRSHDAGISCQKDFGRSKLPGEISNSLNTVNTEDKASPWLVIECVKQRK